MASKNIGKLDSFAKKWMTAFNGLNVKDRNVSGVIKIKAYRATDIMISFLFDRKISGNADDLYGELVRCAPDKNGSIKIDFFTRKVFDGVDSMAFYPKVSWGKQPIKTSDLDEFFESVYFEARLIEDTPKAYAKSLHDKVLVNAVKNHVDVHSINYLDFNNKRIPLDRIISPDEGTAVAFSNRVVQAYHELFPTEKVNDAIIKSAAEDYYMRKLHG